MGKGHIDLAMTVRDMGQALCTETWLKTWDPSLAISASIGETRKWDKQGWGWIEDSRAKIYIIQVNNRSRGIYRASLLRHTPLPFSNVYLQC